MCLPCLPISTGGASNYEVTFRTGITLLVFGNLPFLYPKDNDAPALALHSRLRIMGSRY